MKISLASEADANELLAINSLFTDPYEHPEEFVAENLIAKRILVAKVDNRIVGYLLYQMLWGNTPFLALIKIIPELQSHGFGSALLAEFEATLRKQKFEKYISSTETINDMGQKFHERSGFKLIGELQMIYGEESFYVKEL